MLPSYYIPHGGGPCFFMDWNPPDTWNSLAAWLRSMAADIPRPKAVVTDSFTLVGTMIYSNKQVAFFDGSGSRFKKAVQPKDTIGDHTLVSVEIDKVRLENKGKIIDFAIGAQFRRQDDGPWEMIASTIGSRAADVPAKSGGDQGGATAGDDDEIVRRLLKKREQELNK